jgi:D-2-hydroxyacid dehydrogenase (NADP+)
MPQIIISLGGEGYFAFPDEELSKIRAAFPSEEVVRIAPSELSSHISEARAVLLWQFPQEALSLARQLQFVMYAADGLGPKRIYPALISSPVQVVNTRGVRAQGMAEHAVGSLLSLSRRLLEARDAQQKKTWLKKDLIEEPLPTVLSGKTAVIFGLGEIGSRIARILSAGFGMKVIAVREDISRGAQYVDAVFHSSQRHLALSGAHVVLMALPPTEKTKNIISTDEFSALAPGAFLVNVGRGASLDEEALVRAIQSGHLRGAALDVFHEEPLPASSPLWSMPQILITPHSAGVTPNLWRDINQIFIENLHRAARGLALLNLVDKARGY